MIDHLLKWERWNLYNHNNQYNFKLFFAEEIENIKRNQFYFDAETHIVQPPINIVSRLVRTNSLSKADNGSVPHPWVSVTNNYKYKNHLINLSTKISILISKTDDTSPKYDLPNTLEFRKCIECFLCQDTCHVIRDHEENKKSFAGPRFFIRIAELDMHPLDMLKNRKKKAQEEHSLGMCNITKCCTEVCPEHIRITDNAIIPMKERVVDIKYDPARWLGSKIRKREGIV